MKTNTLLFFGSLLVLVSCQQNKTDLVRSTESVPLVYIEVNDIPIFFITAKDFDYQEVLQRAMESAELEISEYNETNSTSYIIDDINIEYIGFDQNSRLYVCILKVKVRL
ncbi:MAG: hypothetical protein RID18_09700 [Cytophagales bacterium]